MKLLYPLLLLLLIYQCLCPSVNAATITVVTEYLEPYQTKNSDGSVGGFSTEVIHELFKITGDQADINVLPWARAYLTAKNKPNVLIYSIARTNFRENMFHWIGEFHKTQLYFWGLKKNFTEEFTLKQLQHLRVSVSRDSNVAEYLKQQNFSAIYQTIKEEQSLPMLFLDRVDLVIATQLTMKTRAKKLNLDFNKLQRLQELSSLDNSLNAAFNTKTPPDVVDKYKKAFQKLKSNGKLKSIKEKWQIQ